jgi:hypothetical protein
MLVIGKNKLQLHNHRKTAPLEKTAKVNAAEF